MVERVEMGYSLSCHSLIFFLGYYSLLHPLTTVFVWTICIAYCSSILFQQLWLSILTSSIILHYSAIFFLLLCISLTVLRCKFSKLFEKSTLYRLGSDVGARRFPILLFFSAVSSFVVSTAFNGGLSYQDLIGYGMVLIFMDLGCIPSLIDVCLIVPVSGYSQFDREKYFKRLSDEANIFSAMRNVVLDHFMKLLLLNCTGFFSTQVNIFCERLKKHLIVAFLSSLTLFPVLTRINFTNSSPNPGFLDFRLTRLVAKDGNRLHPESDSAPSQPSSSAFQPVYSSLRHTAHLFFSFILVIINLVSILYSAYRTLVLVDFDFNFADVQFTLSNLWIFFGSCLISLTFFYKLKHILSWDATREFCVKPKMRRSRLRTESESYKISQSNVGVNGPLLSLLKATSDSIDIDMTSHLNKNLVYTGDQKEVDSNTFPLALKSSKPVCAAKYPADESDVISALSDAEVLRMVREGRLKTRELETAVKSLPRAVNLRRQDLASRLHNSHAVNSIPYSNYDYRAVMGQCCEEVIGYIPIPLGKVGPLLLDGKEHYVPMATTEGCLVASTNRGCRALFLSGGVKTALFRDQMTRAPVVFFPSIAEVVKCIAWVESPEGFQTLRSAFNETSSHAELVSVFPNPAGRYLHLRFAARTGEAMGMNMVSKGTDRAIRCLNTHFPRMQVISLSGNMCSDKKPAVINHVMGRGKSVLAEARIPGRVVARTLHTESKRLARLTQIKNWTGSAMAGAPGMAGSNAHAANLVAAVFAATGQDLAQVVDSSACLTQLEAEADGSLYVSVTMPCIEVGTVGGGTRLPAQRACLEMLDLQVERPAEHLARLVAGIVLAGEISLLAALATHDLVQAHMRLNRAAAVVAVATAGSPTAAESGLAENGDTHTSPNVKHFAM